METLEPGRHNIVVLGAGFGGVTAARALHRLLKKHRLARTFNLVLVNRTPQQLYTAALYEIASIPKGTADALRLKSAICIQIEDMLAGLPGVRFIGESVAVLDPERHVITFESGNQLHFDYAVVALGAETNFFDIPGMEAHAYPIKTFEDAVRLRNRVEELLPTVGSEFRVVIGGAGATGVELAAEFVNFFGHIKRRILPKRCREKITIIEAAPGILPGFSPAIVKGARKRLGRLGITILTDSAIRQVSASAVTCGTSDIPYDLLVWSGGVKAASVLKNFGLPLDKKGSLLVNQFLEARPRIYAIGDNASLMNEKTGRPMPWTALVAEIEAVHAAKNIIAAIEGRPGQPFRPKASYPFILAAGRKYALSDLAFLKLFGFIGWVAKQLVELKYLASVLPLGKALRMWLRAVYYGMEND